MVERRVHDACSTELRAVVQLARQVGQLLVEVQQTDRFDATAKDDGSPVTRADRGAHDMLARALPRIAGLPVVSEESAPHENQCRLECPRVWIVDPLDGTRAFITGSRQYTVNIALVENGVPVLGVIDAPGLGLTYYAERGAGAYRIAGNGDAERVRCMVRSNGRTRIVVSGSDAALPWSCVPVIADADVEAVSSCVKLGFVAEGSALAYPRVTPSSEWDIAAGHAIVTEAGGRVIRADGCDLTYNKADPINPPFVATGSVAIAASAAELLAVRRRR